MGNVRLPSEVDRLRRCASLRLAFRGERESPSALKHLGVGTLRQSAISFDRDARFRSPGSKWSTCSHLGGKVSIPLPVINRQELVASCQVDRQGRFTLQKRYQLDRAG